MFKDAKKRKQDLYEREKQREGGLEAKRERERKIELVDISEIHGK